MKYLFGTALTTDITLLNNRVEEMSHAQERIVHDVNNQITLSKIWEDHIKINSNKLRLLVKQAKFQTRETEKLRQNIIRWENDTDIETQQDRRTNSYLREIDVHLLRVYADVTELAMGLELAALNRLAAILMPVDRLTEVLQQITVHLPPGLNFLRPVKSEFMYVFYSVMQVHAITYDGVIRLLIQMPLREVQSTYAVYRAIPLPTYSPEMGRYIQINHEDKWLAVSADRRAYYELEPEYYRNCKFGHVNFCEVTSPRMDRSHDSCLGGLFYGKGDEILKYCERSIVGKDFKPVMRRLKTNQDLWVYSVSRPITFEERCGDTRKPREVVLRDAGWIQQPEGCDWTNENMALKAWRSLQSSYTVEYHPVLLPKIRTLFLKNERQVLQEQPNVLKEILESWDTLNENGGQATFPATQLFRQLQERQEAAMTQYHAILVTSAIAAALVVTLGTFMLVRRREVLCKPSAHRETDASAIEEGVQVTPAEEGTSGSMQPEPRFTPRRVNVPIV